MSNIVAGGKAHEFAHRCRHGRHGEDVEDGFQVTRIVWRLFLDGPDDARAFDLAERRAYIAARFDVQAIGNGIVEGLGQGQREEDAGDLHRLRV